MSASRANDQENRISRSSREYLDDYGFEKVIVRYRQKQIVEILRKFHANTIVEVGCGTDLLFDAVTSVGLPISKWVTVEPAENFYSVAAKRAVEDDRLSVIDGFFEESVSAVSRLVGSDPDVIVFAGVISEVADAATLLNAARSLMSEKTVLHISTANALSLHRRLGKAMGIVEDEFSLSDRNKKLEQSRVYDLAALLELINDAGISVIDTGGYFLKPFTHRQMEKTSPVMTVEVLDGLYRLGQELPSLAVEIFVNAKVSR